MTFREPERFDDARKAELVKAILDAPCEQGHATIADQLDLNRETVRRIRFGYLWKNVLPDMERLETGRGGLDRIRTCEHCIHWKHGRIESMEHGVRVRRIGLCTLDIPESIHPKFARGCGAFTEREVLA
jgi:hypothetical protein